MKQPKEMKIFPSPSRNLLEVYRVRRLQNIWRNPAIIEVTPVIMPN
jgi:hypothetical protein